MNACALRRRQAVYYASRQGAGVAIPTVDTSESGVADPYGILQYPGKHGLKITGRVRYDLKHLRGRGLLLQRFGEVGGSLAQLVLSVLTCSCSSATERFSLPAALGRLKRLGFAAF